MHVCARMLCTINLEVGNPSTCERMFTGSILVQADICQLGMDQRKVNVLAREYCDEIKRKLKPVILSHQMMPGLLQVCSLPRAIFPRMPL